MAIFKCKMCGGTLEINNNETVAVCEYCGTKQTLPKLNDERKANLYDRANHFRRNNEFDKAMGIYEQILNDDNTDAESYWSIVLCRYGIEYVEDPKTKKRIPTVNRAQYTSVYADEDYKSAIQYADRYQKEIYEEEAKVIDEIQKGILEISQKEEPFDVFICYKETDANGRRTPDSVLATELYHELTRDGFKVFFSRITLEDKLGEEYEPYIFAALNSAKVMVVLGTKPEHFNAVWVKNEWSRYLALIKNGAKKMLVPAYKDMDPYDLPEEFSHLQAQDMSKLGFMQDLVRGISKIISSAEPKTEAKETVVVNNVNTNIAPLLKRAFMFLEDGDWTSANEYCEKVLDLDPECAEAYLGKLMVELQVKTQDELKDCESPFYNSNNYQKAIRFADEKLKVFLNATIQFINERNKINALDEVYNRAKDLMNIGQEYAYREAGSCFESIAGYKDADTLVKECEERAEIARKDALYSKACSVLDDSHKWDGKETDIKAFEETVEILLSLDGWKDSQEKILICKQKIEEIKIQEKKERLEREKQLEQQRLEKEKQARRNKLIKIIVILFSCILLTFVIMLITVIIPNSNYNKAKDLIDKNQYQEAILIFEKLGDYKDSKELIVQIRNEHPSASQVGDTITYGYYEQDNNIDNGKEEIEWIVIGREEDRVLVVSKFALDCKPYNSTDGVVSWKNSSIRKWLNNDFFNNAFNKEQQKNIILTENKTEFYIGHPYSTSKVDYTEDLVFLLSADESITQCDATVYAKDNGVYSSGNGCIWWLRNTDQRNENQTYAKNVGVFGSVSHVGTNVSKKDLAVRPAMWLDAKGLE